MSEMLSGVLEATDLDGPGFLYGVAAVLAGAWLKGYTGFGASMLWMTSLSLVLPPLQVVPMVLMFEVVTSIALLPQVWKDVRWRSIGLLLLGTWAATPIGIHALSSLPAAPIRMALAAVVFIAAFLILRGFALTKEPGRLATAGVGLMAGVLNGSMGIVGPPVILFYFSSPGRRGRGARLDHHLLHRHRQCRNPHVRSPGPDRRECLVAYRGLRADPDRRGSRPAIAASSRPIPRPSGRSRSSC